MADDTGTPDWIDVQSSRRIKAMAYDAGNKLIYVRFPDGTEWAYGSCDDEIWNAFSKADSKGAFIRLELDNHPHTKSG